jgi:hypothetical protein
MLIALYKTKKSLKESKGKSLRYQETSMFGPEMVRLYNHEKRKNLKGILT